jgi:hypothetical protein
MRRSLFVAALTLCLAPALAAPAGAFDGVRGTFERTFAVGPGTELDVRTGSGDIQVRAGAPGRVHVVGTVEVGRSWWRRRGGAEARLREILAHPPLRQEPGRVWVGHEEQVRLMDNVSISYLIEAPPDVKLDASTGSGDELIRGLRGHVEAGTGSGDIRVWDAPAGIRAHTGSGNIELHSVGGALRAETGSGGVLAEGSPGGEWQVRTGSGDVTLRLPAAAAFELEAHTGSGDIQCAHPLTSVGRLHHSSLQGTVRGGGPRVSIRTGSGDVDVR